MNGIFKKDPVQRKQAGQPGGSFSGHSHQDEIGIRRVSLDVLVYLTFVIRQYKYISLQSRLIEEGR